MAKKSNKSAGGLASKEDITQKFLSEASANYERYKTQRENIDENNRKADAMYKAAQNRSFMVSEQSKSVGLDKDPRSNVGSPIYFRIVNTMASILYGILVSREDMFRYETIGSEGVRLSKEDALRAAHSLNALARWTRKQDNIDEKLPEFCTSVFKLSNIFAMVYQHRRTEKVITYEPVYQTSVDENGEPYEEIIDQREVVTERVVENFPCISFPHPSSIYCDRYIPKINGQYCVIIETLKTYPELASDAAAGWIDQKQFEKLGEDNIWDGTSGWEQKEQEQINRNDELNASGTKQYLVRDIFMYAPIEGGAWGDDKPQSLYWCTAIGNTLEDSLVVRLVENQDPDGEIPLKEIRACPDNSDELYHTTMAEVVMSSYAADCTMLNLGIDNLSQLVDPPLTILDGLHRIKDFSFKRGQRWHVDRHDAIKQFDIRDGTQQIAALRDQIQRDVKTALNADPAFVGEYAGARTSATEFQGVNQISRNPIIMQMRYIISQFLPWMARKYLSYWNRYGTPVEVKLITDDEKQLDPMNFKYDIISNVVDEYISDTVKSQTISNIMQVIGSVPFFQQSEFHTIDAGELIKEWLSANRYNAARIVSPSVNGDAEEVANNENSKLMAGTYVPPQQGQHHTVHLRQHKAERVKWRGMEDSGDPRAANLQLLDQHIAETENMVGGGAGTPPVGPQNETPGEVAGNEIAGAMGAR